jgi:hypothetical protein
LSGDAPPQAAGPTAAPAESEDEAAEAAEAAEGPEPARQGRRKAAALRRAQRRLTHGCAAAHPRPAPR